MPFKKKRFDLNINEEFRDVIGYEEYFQISNQRSII